MVKGKPIGFVKRGKSYSFVFGSRTKPRVSSKKFRTKKALLASIAPKRKRK